MTRRPIDARVETGPHRDEGRGAGVSPDTFREALSRWASAVAIVAVRDEAAVHATTVSSFASVSAEPPRILLSLGPTARVLPFLAEEGRRFTVNVLSEGQRRLATVFADSYPVGPSPFPPEGDPRIQGAHVVLTCTVDSVIAVGDVRMVIGLVVATELGESGGPLLYHRREYWTLS